MTDSKTLVITGANGYLGKHTINAAISKGWDVVGIVRREEAAKEVKSLGAKAAIITKFNFTSLKEILEDCKAIIHFRGAVCGSKELFEEINIEGMGILCKAAKYMNVSRIIFPSGLGVDMYNKTDWASNEYFRSKKEAEEILINSEVPYIIFRPSYILGPDDELIPDLIEQIGSGTVEIAGNGDIPMQPLSVITATNAFLAAADGKGEDNQVYDLVGLEIVTMRNLIEMVVENMKKTGFNIPLPRIQSIPYDKAPDHFELCKEMIDIMRCDLTSDGTITAKALGFELTELSEAIENSIKAKLFPKLKQSEKKAIILLSGGLDSAVALYWAVNEGYDLIALSINYHLRPEKEKEASLKLTSRLGVKLIEIPIGYLKEAIDLRIEGFPVPSALYSPEGFIPSRNLVFYSVASYYAEIYGCNFIIGGHIFADTRIFADADVEFFKTLEDLINRGKHPHDKTKIRILLPLIKLSKLEVVKLAKKFNIPLEWTWSCYSDGESPCGQCSSCLKRIKALNELIS
ncbi:MAG: 7-cyano-7-deazaguanine synthase [Promethearchaeota archaeon]|jgi:7-cyano-7-deazaguanine synthase